MLLNVFQAAGNSCANVTKKRRGKTLFSFGLTANSSKKQRSVPDPDDNSQQGTLKTLTIPTQIIQLGILEMYEICFVFLHIYFDEIE